ncbi:DUF6882 domain-containing protein [Thalassoglobus sp.]|uniref:DUF6882 domain-containing protein n=1 Tax=Thalassoglobus sp. TaxID=2795869 RepID=UPI003AA84928
MNSFRDLFAKHVGTAFAHQLALADHVENRNWNLDLSIGTVSFGDGLEYPVQLLGSEALGNNQTWMWAWANDGIDPNPETMTLVHQLKEYGEKESLPELYEPSFSLNRATGHELAMVASGISGNVCYYCGPYEGGAVYFVIKDLPDSFFEPAPPERVIRVLSEVIATFEVNHRTMAESFLESQNYDCNRLDSKLEASRGATHVSILFDEQGRISNMNGTIPPRKRWWQFWK